MKKVQLYEQLKTVNATREKRLENAALVLETPSLFKPLLEIVFMVDDHLSAKAAWVFEFVCAKDLGLIKPHLDYFTRHLTKVHLDSAVRPVAKICKFLVEQYYTKSTNQNFIELSLNHKEAICEACFNWMLNDEKVAPKVYAMTCLYLLGRDFSWVHSELLLILEKDYSEQSPGFKAKARHILKKIS